MRKYKPIPRGCTGGWEKPDGGPLIGRDTCIGYDMSIMKEGDTYRMWYSSAAGTISACYQHRWCALGTAYLCAQSYAWFLLAGKHGQSSKSD